MGSRAWLLASLEPAGDLWANFRELPGYLTFSTIGAAVVAALIAFTGPVLLIVEVAADVGLSTAQLNSWVFAIFVGGGVASLVWALLYRQPICGAWSIAGTALLAATLTRYTLAEAVGAYLVSGFLVVLLALSGLFGRLMARIPPPIIMGMLAGVLFRFGVGIFTPAVREPWLVVAMVLALVVLQRIGWQAPTLGALGVGMVLAAATGQIRLAEVSLRLTAPEVYVPAFSPEAILSMSVPLALLALVTQNAPAVGVLVSQGYRAPSNAITLVSGVGSLATAAFGGHGINVASMMTAVCSSPAAHSDREGRYAATVVNGVLLIAFGLAGATATSLMLALPRAVISIVAGLAMIPVLMQALRQSVGQDQHAFGAFFALVIAASDVSLGNVGAAFWALVGGVALSRLLDRW